jgi:hypothetical protein
MMTRLTGRFEKAQIVSAHLHATQTRKRTPIPYIAHLSAVSRIGSEGMPRAWLEWIDQPLFDHELTVLRTCLNRQRPFGSEDWQAAMAVMHGLESTLRQRGRPSKVVEK